MKNTQIWTVAIALFLIGMTACDVLAGFKLPNLNPFAKKDPAPKPAPPKPPSKSMLSWPKLPSLPKVNLFPPKKPGEPSTWQKMNAGTKSFVDKTVDFLNPWDSKPAPKQSRRVTGTQRVYDGSPSASKQEPKTKSGFLPKISLPNPFKPSKPAAEPPRAVNDFLKRPRPPID